MEGAVMKPRTAATAAALIAALFAATLAAQTPVAEGLEDLSYAELLLSLPPDWRLRQEDFKDESNYWPVRMLKMLTRMPHEYDTWLGEAHTIPNGDPPKPYAPNTKLCCAMLAPPLLVPDEFRELTVTPEMSIHFYGVIPIY
jgi:hypothetical protein